MGNSTVVRTSPVATAAAATVTADSPHRAAKQLWLLPALKAPYAADVRSWSTLCLRMEQLPLLMLQSTP